MSRDTQAEFIAGRFVDADDTPDELRNGAKILCSSSPSVSWLWRFHAVDAGGRPIRKVNGRPCPFSYEAYERMIHDGIAVMNESELPRIEKERHIWEQALNAND